MPKKKSKKKIDSPDAQVRIERRLEALIVLFAGLLSQQDNAVVERAKEKAAVLLINGGISQDNTARLLGMDRNKVTKASKNIKL